jgi:hypothetical protein
VVCISDLLCLLLDHLQKKLSERSAGASRFRGYFPIFLAPGLDQHHLVFNFVAVRCVLLDSQSFLACIILD